MARETRTRKIQRKLFPQLPTMKGGRHGLLSFIEHLLWARACMRHFVCFWSWSPHLVSENLYDEGTERQRNYGISEIPELGKSLYLNLYNFTLILLCKWSSRVFVTSCCGDWRGFLHGPRLTPAVLWGAFQFWSSCTVLVDWGSVAGELRAEKMQEKCFVGKSSVRQNEMNDKWDWIPPNVPNNKMLHKEAWQFSC